MPENPIYGCINNYSNKSYMQTNYAYRFNVIV